MHFSFKLGVIVTLLLCLARNLKFDKSTVLNLFKYCIMGPLFVFALGPSHPLGGTSATPSQTILAFHSLDAHTRHMLVPVTVFIIRLPVSRFPLLRKWVWLARLVTYIGRHDDHTGCTVHGHVVRESGTCRLHGLSDNVVAS